MRRLRYGTIWWGLGLAYLALIITLSLVSEPPRIAEFPQSDKVKHLAAYAILMAYFSQLLEKRALLLAFAGGFMALGGLLEILQGLGGVRSMELLDALANAAGVALGYWLGPKLPVYRHLLLP